MRKLLAGAILIGAAFWQPYAAAGDAEADSVPFVINYQGRLEQNNAPVNGTVPMVFRIMDAATGGNVLWTSPELIVTVTEGIFGTSFEPPMSIIGKAGSKYLQITVDNDALSPAERMHSVPFAYVAAALADGSNITVSTSIATYGYADSFSATRIYINGQEWTGSTQTSVASVYSSANVSVGVGAPASSADGHITFFVNSYSAGKVASFYPNGSLLLGGSAGAYDSTNPQHRLMVDGDIGHYADSVSPAYFGLLHKTGVTVRPSSRYSATYPNGLLRVMPLADSAARRAAVELYAVASDTASVNPASYARGVFEMSGSSLAIRTEASGAGVPLSFETAGESRVLVSTYGFVTDSNGAHSAWVYFSSDVYVRSGLRSGDVVVGAHGGSSPVAGAAEIMSPAGALIIQGSTGTSVGIGISTPSASYKLHVNGSAYFENSVTVGKLTNPADRLVINSSNTAINGNLLAYTYGRDNRVELPTTTIYGTLNVINGISVNGNGSAYLGSTQTFTGTNTFFNPVHVTSNVFTLGYPAVPAVDVSKGLFIVGGESTDNARLSLVAGTGQGAVGTNADSELYFYRGSTEAARFATGGDSNLSLYVNKSARAEFSADGNIALALSTASETQLSVTGGGLLVKQDPDAEAASLLVSASDGRVAVGTSSFGSNSQLTVAGSMRVSGTGAGIYFPDNSFLTSASAVQATAEAVSNSTNAVVTGGTDSGIGSVVLQVGAGKADVVIRNKEGPAGVANMGIGTDDPADRLHILLGNLRVGSRSISNPFGGNSAIVENGLLVSKSAYLATASGSVGIGTSTPGGFKLGVEGDINTSGGLYGNGALRLTSAGALKNIAGMDFASTAVSSYTLATDNKILNLNPGSSHVNLATDLYVNGTQFLTVNRWLSNINVFNQTVGTFVSTGVSSFLSSSTAMEISAATSFKLSSPYFDVRTDGTLVSRFAGAAALEFTGAGAGISFSGTGAKRITAANDLYIEPAGVTAIGGTSKSTFSVTGALTLNSPLAVGSGGTGAGTFTQYGLLYGNGAGTMGVTAQGSAEHLLQANGAAAPSWVLSTSTAGLNTIVRRDASGNATFNKIYGAIEGTATVSTNIAAGALGYLPYQSAANTTVFLPPSAAGSTHLLYSTGTTPLWALATSTGGFNSIVMRDSGGNFSAGTITAGLTGTASSATHLAGGGASQVPYQTAAGVTAYTATPSANYAVLYSASGASPAWLTATSGNTASALVMRDASGNSTFNKLYGNLEGTALISTNIAAGALGYLPYQSGSNATVFLAPPAAGNTYLLYSTGTTPLWALATSTSGINSIVRRDAGGNFSAGTITGDLTGTAASATNLTGGTGGTGQVVYQSAAGATAYTASPGNTADRVLYSITGAAPIWRQATYSNTGNTVVTRDGSGNTSVSALSANSVAATGDVVAGNMSTTGTVMAGTVDVTDGISAASVSATGKITAVGGFGANGNNGLNTTFTVVTSTTGPACSSLTFTGGLLTTVTTGVACP
ncbi:MAG: hypothetical protein PHW69_08975 [Elusimicrobiaceae bacterium]|nr:hypothetical protein [Elusimicrobiaceae bacterium]